MIDQPTIKEHQTAADALRAVTGVLAVDVISEDPRFADGRTVLEVTVTGEYERVPPRVLRALAEHDLGLWATDYRGMHESFRVVAI